MARLVLVRPDAARPHAARLGRWPAAVVASAVLAGLVVAGCGISGAAPQNAGKPASLSLSLTTVQTFRSVTVSPAKASFGNCTGGLPSMNTPSTTSALGFPSGRCLVGLPSIGFFPITITNVGVAAIIDVSGSPAFPADNGDQWSLCSKHGDGGPACSRADGTLPGTDQYFLETISAAGAQAAGISATPTCDAAFHASGRCWALHDTSQGEAIELVGPAFSTDTSTKWTMTITWTPVPSQG